LVLGGSFRSVAPSPQVFECPVAPGPGMSARDSEPRTKDETVQPSLRERLASVPARPWPDRPVGVALVITDLDVGGAERAVTALAARLNPARWRPGVFCLGRPGALAGVLRNAGVPCECLGAGRRNPVAAIARLAIRLRRFDPELVQSFLFHANLASRLAAPW